MVLGLLGNAKNWRAWYLKHYLQVFFKVKRIRAHQVNPIPEQLTAPSVIFTHRYEGFFQGLFLYKLCPFPVIVPLPSESFKLRVGIVVPVGKFGEHVSYPDDGLSVTMPYIRQLLQAGYHVVVYINKGKTDNSYQEEMGVDPLILTLLLDETPCYFLRVTGWESYPLATILTPLNIFTGWKSQQELLGPTSGLDLITLESRLRAFFRYPDLTVAMPERNT